MPGTATSAEHGTARLRACLVLNAAEVTLEKLPQGIPEGADATQVPDFGALPPLARSKAEGISRSGFADGEISRAARSGYRIITAFDEEYPPLLKRIPDPPLVLYVQGDPAALSLPSIAIVGSRLASAYGRTIAGQLASRLALRGLCIVSGFAVGIDSEAHWSCLRAGGTTCAILGCAVDYVRYPLGSGKLRQAIAGRGCLASEFPFGTRPAPFTFPRRNRIVSGLSLGVVVAEATLTSGALITARLAGEQGREVFAVPGSVYSPTSHGVHALLRDGAKLTEDAEDVLEEIKTHFTPSPARAMTRSAPEKGSTEARILDALGARPVHVDELGRRLSLPMSALIPALSVLEMRGCVRQGPGKVFSLA